MDRMVCIDGKYSWAEGRSVISLELHCMCRTLVACSGQSARENGEVTQGGICLRETKSALVDSFRSL